MEKEILNKILEEINNLKSDIKMFKKDVNKRFDEQSEQFDKKLSDVSEQFDKKINNLSQQFETKLQNQVRTQNIYLEKTIARQNEDLAIMFTDVAEYEKGKRDENFKKLDNKIDKEMKKHKEEVKNVANEFIKAVS